MKFFYETFFFFFFICVQFLFLDSILAAKFYRNGSTSNNSVIFDSGKTYKRNIRSSHVKHGKEVGDDVILSGYGQINLILLYKELTFEVCNDCAGISRVCYESEISSDDYEDVFGSCHQSSSCQFKVKDIGYALFFGGEQIFEYKFTGCLQVKMESLVATRFPSCKPKMDDKSMIKLFVDIDPECSIKVKNAKIYVPPTTTKSKSTIKVPSTKSKVLPPTKSPSKHPSKSSLFPIWGYIIIIVGIVILIVILIIGWMNILNEPYNVHTSCYKNIQSVLVQLEGPILRISRPERLVMKHCTHDDPTFTEDYPPMLSQSTFDITNAKIKLRPKHLARRRWWVRRYPICIVLASPDDKMHIRDDERFAELQTDLSEDGTTLINRKAPNQLGSITDDAINVARMSAERDSVATGAYDSDSDHEYELESEGEQVELRASASTDRIAKSSLQKNFPGPNTKPRGRTIYLFARTPREKERWFHVLRKACNKFSKPPHESDALELEKKMFLPEGWSLPENMNKHYFLYVLQEFRYGKHLDKVLTASVDNRTKREHLLANGGIVNMDLGRIGWHRSAHYQTDDLVVIANMSNSS
uniref:PH domain-containing protein n=1 Tax=Panagrolaimus davidi TaxID=227884 RepID=A0A914QHT9_9BILA